MKTVFSTVDVHQRDAFDYWHEILCKKIIRHDCTPEHRPTFRAKLQSKSLADIELVYYDSSSMVNDVTVRHVGHANADELLVRRQISGVFVVEQDSP